MDKEMQDRLVSAARDAMRVISVAGLDMDLVYRIRDILRAVEKHEDDGV
jgi:hypothetical protein